MESTQDNVIVKTEVEFDVKPDIPALNTLNSVKPSVDTKHPIFGDDILPVKKGSDLSNISTLNPKYVSADTESSRFIGSDDVNTEHHHSSSGYYPRRPSQERWKKKFVHNCDLCNISHYGFRQNFIRHLKLHLGLNRSLTKGDHSIQKSKNITCQFCDKKFSCLSHYKAHEPVHTGIKPYVCDLCNKRYSRKIEVERHIYRVHIGLQNTIISSQNKKSTIYIYYKCEFCLKVYSGNEALQTHRRTKHTGERPFKCHLCEKAFFEKRSLKLHLTSGPHGSGERPFVCTECPASAIRKSNLISHYQIKHKTIHKSDLSTRNLVRCGKCGKNHYSNVSTSAPVIFKPHLCYDTPKDKSSNHKESPNNVTQNNGFVKTELECDIKPGISILDTFKDVKPFVQDNVVVKTELECDIKPNISILDTFKDRKMFVQDNGVVKTEVEYECDVKPDVSILDTFKDVKPFVDTKHPIFGNDILPVKEG